MSFLRRSSILAAALIFAFSANERSAAELMVRCNQTGLHPCALGDLIKYLE